MLTRLRNWMLSAGTSGADADARARLRAYKELYPVKDQAELISSLIASMEAKDKRLLTHLCTLLVLERTLAKLLNSSPIVSLDPITSDAATFVYEEVGDISFPQALDLLKAIETHLWEQDVPQRFMKYNRLAIEALRPGG